METDTTELQSLISQRQLRPSYTRAISYELSQTCSVAAKSKKSKRSRKLKTVSTELSETHSSSNTSESEEREFSDLDIFIDNEKSDDSEYFSAEENSVALECAPPDNSSMPPGLDSTEDPHRYSCPLKERKRAPSKKQKRKRRLASGDSNSLKELPFFGVIDIVDDLSEIEITQNSRSVPTLSTLCLKVLAKNKKNWRKPSAVPRVLRQNITNVSEFYKEKVSWINIILAEFEEENQLADEFTIHTRTVWDVDISSPLHRNREIGCLPLSYLYSFNMDHYYQFISANHIMTALSCILHLLIPEPDPCKGNHKKKKHWSTPYERAVENATAPLWKSYPRIMKRFYENVVPYVFWARGDVIRAKESFHRLIEASKKPRFKALYMYEIGRMMQFFDDPSQLNLTLTLSEMTEMFQINPYYCQGEVYQLILRQTTLLKANLCDQGVMTLDRARLASERWAYCLGTQPSERQVDREHFFYMDSLLCYHAHSVYDMGIDWIQNAIEKLEPFCYETCPELRIFLSMLYAMQGNKMRCEMAFREFMYHSVMDMVIDDRNGDCPWLALMDMMKTSSDVRPLRVLWRTQLNPPRFLHSNDRWPDIQENGDPFEADISGRELNLHLTPEGHLTGDLQMSLPPISSVLLNPYTGAIAQLPAVHKTTPLKSFHSVNCYGEGRRLFTPVSPTPMEIYKGQNGTVVTMIFLGLTYTHNVPRKHLLKLIWRGPNGERKKINLAVKLREFMYKEAMERVKKLGEEEPIKACMLEILRLCYVRDYAIPSVAKNGELFVIVQEAYSGVPKKSEHEKAKPSSSATLDPVKIFNQLRGDLCPVLDLKDPPLIFGEDIFLRLKVNKSVTTEVFVVIHTQNQREFKNPTIQEIRDPPLCNFSSQISKSAELFYYVNQNPRVPTVCTLNRYLQLVDKVDTGLLQPIVEDDHVPFIIRNSLFAISYSNCVYRMCDQMETIAEHLGSIHRMTHLGDMLVLVTTTGYLQFVESQTLLPVKATVHPRAFLLILDDLYIYEVPNYLKVLGEDSFRDANNQEFVRAALLLDNKLVIIKIQPSMSTNSSELSSISVTSAVTLPGQAKDVHFLSESGGYLVSASIFRNKDGPYRENLYHFDHRGQLLGILPSLGRGPRSMFSVFLPGDLDLSAKHSGRIGQKGWHVYMRDGHDGIICVFLGLVSISDPLEKT